MPPKEEHISLRELVRDISDKQNAIQIDIAVIKSQGVSYREIIIDHDKEIEKLKEGSNKQKGAMWAIGIGGVGGILGAIKAFFGQ